MEFNEVQHSGVKGMKWGIRRYQNKDGTLTSAGRAKYLNKAREYERKANTSVADNYFAKSRRARLTEKAKDARREVRRSDLAKARIKKQQAENTKKSIKDMSDDELQSAIRRMQLEQQYKQLNPQKVSVGKKYAMKAVNDIIVPSVTNASRQYVEKQLKKALGLETTKKPDPMDALRKEVNDLNTKKQKIELDDFFKKREEEAKKKN